MKVVNLSVSALLLLQSGCGTMTGGFFWNVPLESSEPGTAVRVYKDGEYDQTVWAPDYVTLFPLMTKRVEFRFEKDGYETVSVARMRMHNAFADEANGILSLCTCFLWIFPAAVVDGATGSWYEFDNSRIYAQMTKTPEAIDLESGVARIRSVDDWRGLAKRLDILTAIDPGEKERVVEPLPREALVGTWQCKSHIDGIVEWDNSGRTRSKRTSSDRIDSWDFKDDGTYTTTTVCDGNSSIVSGTYMYEGGSLTLVPKMSDGAAAQPQFWRVDWFSGDSATIRWRSESEGRAFWSRFSAAQELFANQRNLVSYKIDPFGCTWLALTYVGTNGSQVEKTVESPRRYSRVSRNMNGGAPAQPSSAYRIVTCERETGSDFAYKFVIELGEDSDQTLAAFRKIQKEFRAAIQADYIESFPRADKSVLRVDFPSYKLDKGRVEGRAVVLSIAVASLNYDPNTRKGVLAARVDANQYEDARNWIRRNIETLARDKNIALTTGEIPPAAKFYLGREELKDGNILEVEFITE